MSNTEVVKTVQEQPVEYSRKWVNDEYHGWLCLEKREVKEQRLRDEKLKELDKKLGDLSKKIEEAETAGNDTADLIEEKKKVEEEKKTKMEEYKKEDEEKIEEKKRKEEEEAKTKNIEKQLIIGKGELISTEGSIYKVHDLEKEELTIIKGDKFEKIEAQIASKLQEVTVVMNTEEGAYEQKLSLNVDSLAKKYFGDEIREDLRKHFCFVTATFYVGEKEVVFVERPKEDNKEVAEANDKTQGQTGEDKQEEVKDEEEKTEKKPENENEEKKEEEKPTEEELAQKKKEEEEAAKQVPEVLIDKKTYFKETEETLEIYSDAKIGHIIDHLQKNDFDCIIIRPTDVSTTQLYDRVLYRLSNDPGCTFSTNEEIYLLGFGLYGPFPNARGIQGFDFEMSVYNAKSKERSIVKTKIEDKKESIYKFFLEKPMHVGRGDSIHIAKMSGQGAVFVLDSQHNLFIGDDDVHFRLYNHLNNMVPSLYYCKPESD